MMVEFIWSIVMFWIEFVFVFLLFLLELMYGGMIYSVFEVNWYDNCVY